jgi:processive 1,2-diacylglycerol beta-glucosyltransferase
VDAERNRDPKLLLAATSAGAGHARAAEALERAFELGGHAGATETVDVLEHMNRFFGTLYVRCYYWIIQKTPWLWRYLYDSWNRKQVEGWQRRVVAIIGRWHARRFFRFLERERPTHLLCTHFLPGELAAWMRRTGRLDAPVAVIITDYDAHGMWLNPGTDHYFVATDDVRDLVLGQGVPPDAVSVSGIPIDPVFADPPDRDTARAELGLDPDRSTLLVTGGGGGMGGVRRTVEALARLGHVQLLAVAGHNEKLKHELDAFTPPPPATLVTYGFVDYMVKLMAASDLMVAKPGGLSSTECLAMGLPMVLTAPIPGQEEKNAAFLVEHGAAVRTDDPDEMGQIVGELLADPARLEQMRQAARKLARPRAAFDIIDKVMELKRT